MDIWYISRNKYIKESLCVMNIYGKMKKKKQIEMVWTYLKRILRRYWKDIVKEIGEIRVRKIRERRSQRRIDKELWEIYEDM